MARILFFGRLGDMTGCNEIAHGGKLKLSELIESLGTRWPELARELTQPSVRIAINLGLIPLGEDPTIGPDDEVAFMPPVSGG